MFIILLSNFSIHYRNPAEAMGVCSLKLSIQLESSLMASCKKLNLSQVHLWYVVISSLLENGGKEVLQETFKFTRVPGLLEFQVNMNFWVLQENQVNLKFT